MKKIYVKIAHIKLNIIFFHIHFLDLHLVTFGELCQLLEVYCQTYVFRNIIIQNRKNIPFFTKYYLKQINNIF